MLGLLSRPGGACVDRASARSGCLGGAFSFALALASRGSSCCCWLNLGRLWLRLPRLTLRLPPSADFSCRGVPLTLLLRWTLVTLRRLFLPRAGSYRSALSV